MFFPESRVRVYLYGQAVDMRKSFDGLYAVAHAAFAQDPTGGDLYVFVSRSGRQIKVLYFDRSGWCVWAKRLEAGRFIADWSKARTHEVDCTGLKMLLEGIEPIIHVEPIVKAQVSRAVGCLPVATDRRGYRWRTKLLLDLVPLLLDLRHCSTDPLSEFACLGLQLIVRESANLRLERLDFVNDGPQLLEFANVAVAEYLF